MKHNLLSTLFVTLALAAPVTLVSAQSTATFELGFKALAAQIPSIAGEPLEDEHSGANGDSLQQTSTGLMVWRRADNWTAFTNGSRTWVNGPAGVEERANEERFEWEAVASSPTPTPTPAPVTPTPVAPLINKDQMARALLQIADMAPGYHTTVLGWIDGYRARAVFEADFPPSGPKVASDLYLYSDDASAQRVLDRTDSGREEFDLLPAPMSGVAGSKLYHQTLFYHGGDTGEIWIVFFRVRNVIGELRTTGLTSVSRPDQALRFAQLEADRLAAQ